VWAMRSLLVLYSCQFPHSFFSMHTKSQDIALLLLRLIIGAVFIYAGTAKFFIWTSSPEGMPAWMVYLMQLLSIVEPIGGAALIIGFLTRWAAKGLAVIMVGAVFFVKFLMQATVFTTEKGSGLDYVLLLLAGCIALAAFGGGSWALDAKKKRL
jgi:putative oxidoreductase